METIKQMNYEEALQYIHSNSWIGTKLGLHRVKYLLGEIKNPQNDLKFVHIAGTNGKGSTASMVASILQASGMTVGLYTSPFIHCFNERMQINGVMIGNQELADITSYIRPFADQMEEKPTEFDLNTAIAMKYFKDHHCDMVVLEVGLGGLLDATNVIEHKEVAVITAIGFDHTKELGDTIEEIAQVKAGIIKDNCDVVMYGRDPVVERVIEENCQKKQARLYKPDYQTLVKKQSSLDGQAFDYKKWHDLYIPFVGTYQLYNACVAIEVIEVLRNKSYRILDDDIIKGLRSAKWSGRFEIINREPIVIVDGSHNPHGMKATKESLSTYFQDKKIVFLVGVMADKDVNQMLCAILPMAQEFITVTPPSNRAMKSDVLADKLSDMGYRATACMSIEEGCKMAVEAANKDGIVCAIGSLYMIDDIKKAIYEIFN